MAIPEPPARRAFCTYHHMARLPPPMKRLPGVPATKSAVPDGEPGDEPLAPLENNAIQESGLMNLGVQMWFLENSKHIAVGEHRSQCCQSCHENILSSLQVTSTAYSANH
jgi:hypothetical protein